MSGCSYHWHGYSAEPRERVFLSFGRHGYGAERARERVFLSFGRHGYSAERARERVFLSFGRHGYSAERARERVFLSFGRHGYSAERARERVFLSFGRHGYSAERARERVFLSFGRHVCPGDMMPCSPRSNCCHVPWEPHCVSPFRSLSNKHFYVVGGPIKTYKPGLPFMS